MRRWASLVLLASLGCTAGTSTLSAPSVRDGELSFGVARHRDQWLGDSVAASTAALSLGPDDVLWRVSEGARRVDHCRAQAGVPVCREASFGLDPPDGRLGLVDPVGLGEDLGGPTSSGVAPSAVLRAHAGAGVWVRGGGAVIGLYYCRLDRGVPSCRAVRFGDAALRPSRVLAVLGATERDVPHDVLWAVRADEEIVRCAAPITVGGAAVEPRCQAARVLGSGAGGP